METIIQQIIKKLVEEIFGAATECELNLEKMTPRIQESLRVSTAEILRTLIELTDKYMLEDKAGRRKEGWVEERLGDIRTIMTGIGELQYRRAYYCNKKTGKYCYPTDLITGVMPYQHVDTCLSKELVSTSRQQSYYNTAKSCCAGEVSSQTVMNKIRKAEAVIDIPSEKKSVPELHIDADEDHVALQRSPSHSGTIVQLVSVYEGFEKNGKRSCCKNVFHISDYGKTPDELWDEVLTRIEQHYDLTNTKIYLHGDGASWICKGKEWLHDAVFVLDLYHKNKYIQQLLAGYDPKKTHQVRLDLNQTLNDQDKDYFDSIVQMLLTDVPQRADKIREAAAYLRSHMPAIAISATDPKARNGGATEPHISHVLSSRLSSRPMGWSKKTLESFAPILANGPEVSFGKEESVLFPSAIIDSACQKAKRSARIVQSSDVWQRSMPILLAGKVTEVYNALNGLTHNLPQ